MDYAASAIIICEEIRWIQAHARDTRHNRVRGIPLRNGHCVPWPWVERTTSSPDRIEAARALPQSTA